LLTTDIDPEKMGRLDCGLVGGLVGKAVGSLMGDEP
jgi:hypothetical protein